MPYLILIFMIFLGFTAPRNKIISIVLFTYMWCIIGFNSFTPDFANYKFMYEQIDSGIFTTFEPGYVMLNHICLHAGLSFTQFRCVVAAIGLLLVYISVLRLTDNYNLLLCIFMLYPVLGYTGGIRSLVAFGFGLLGMTFLVRGGKRRIIKYLICIGLAICFHYSFFVYLIFLFVEKGFNFTRTLKFLIIEISVVLVWSQGYLYSILSRFITSEKVLRWMMPEYNERPSILAAMTVTAAFYLVYYWLHYCLSGQYENLELFRKDSSCVIDTFKVKSYLDVAIYLIPLLFINMNYERLLVLPFGIALSVLSNSECYRRKRLQLQIKLIGVAIVLCLLINNVIHQNIYFPIFVNNQIMEWLLG